MALLAINPATAGQIASYPEHRRGEIERAVVRAHRAQREWRTLDFAARGRHLLNLAAELRRRLEPLAALATTEMGKPITQSRSEIEKCALLCEYYAKQGAALLADEKPAGAPPQGRVAFEPLGVILAIMPWNFPFWQVIRAAVPALVGGNVFLLKHAPNVPGCAVALERLCRRAGLPQGVLQALRIGIEPVPELIADPRIAAVTLTGSTAAGRSVAALAGAALKPVVLELGGSDPAIVLADADLDRAAEACAASRLFNSGQSCVCAKRFIVVRAVLRDFEERFIARMAARRVGDPTDPAVEVGPLARIDLRAKVDGQVRRMVRQGAKVRLGGRMPAGPGYFYPPTVLAGVRPGMPGYDEEVFGPVASIIAVRDDAEAIRVANDTSYGLGANLFTRDRKKARVIATRLEAGCVFVNDFVRSVPELPFGGVKQSGFGRELGPWGARAFMNVKTIWEA